MAARQPTPAELKEALSLLKQLKKGYTDLGDTTNAVFLSNTDNIKDTITQAGGVKSILEKWTLELDKVEDSLETAGKSAKSIYQQFNNIVGEIKKSNQNINLGSKSMSVFQQTAEKLKNDQQGITRLSKTELETLQKQNRQALSNLDIANQALQNQIDNNELIGDELLKAEALVGERKEEATAIKDLIKLTDDRLKKEQEIEKTLGIAPKLLDGLKKIPIIGDVLDIKGAKTAMIEAAEGGASGFQAMGAGVKALGPSLKAALGPLALISLAVEAVQMLIGAMFEADKQVTDIAHNFGVTKDSAKGVRKEFFKLSEQASKFADIQKGNLILETEQLEAAFKMNEILGTQVDYTNDLGEEGKRLNTQFASNVKFLKLSEEEQKGILELNRTSGEEIDDINKSVLGTTRLESLKTGVLLNERKILKDVLTASGAIKLTTKGGAEGLANAAIAAAKLGTNLQGVQNISKGLLNFEDSISAELEAELLTGKELNLDKARQYALEGNIEGVAKEITKNIGSAADFGKMNVIQQEALAKAMGTSREELADMLIQQESLNSLKSTYNTLGAETIKNLENSGKIEKGTYESMQKGTHSAGEYYEILQKAGLSTEELTKTLGDQAFASLQAQSAQDKFNDSLEMAKQTFQKFVDGGSLDKLADFISGLVNRGALATVTGAGAEEESGKSRLEKAGYTVEEGSGLFGTEAFKTTKIFDKVGKEIDSAFGSEGVAGLADIYAPKEIKKADGGIVNPTVQKTSAGGENTKSLNQQTDDVNKNLTELIAVTKAGGNIYLETDKVGTAHNKSTFKLNK
jgi:hypothetical protein